MYALGLVNLICVPKLAHLCVASAPDGAGLVSRAVLHQSSEPASLCVCVNVGQWACLCVCVHVGQWAWDVPLSPPGSATPLNLLPIHQPNPCLQERAHGAFSHHLSFVVLCSILCAIGWGLPTAINPLTVT